VRVSRDVEGIDQDLKFKQYLPDQQSSTYTDYVRDVPSASDFWVVHMVGAYEHHPEADNDPDPEDTEPAWLGYSFVDGGDKVNVIYYETIRDVHDFHDHANLPGLVDLDVLEQRVIVHEALHRFFGWHNDPPWHGHDAADEGIMVYNTALTGGASAISLTPWQIRIIQRTIKPQ
jgi:hypothetical protein